MKRPSSYAVIGLILALILGTSGWADAQRRNEKQVRDIVRSLNAQIDEFQYSLDHEMKTTSAPGADIDEMHDSVRALQTDVDDFEENLNNRKENRDDVRAIVMSAIGVDSFLMRSQQNQKIETSWQNVQKTINNLASNYGVIPDWNRGVATTTSTSVKTSSVPARPSGTPPVRTSNGRQAPTLSVATSPLTGTYALDTSKGDNTSDIISNANVGDDDQRQDLETKLSAPEQIALDVRGTEVTLASSKVSPITFVADGRDKTDNENGKTIRTRATIRGEELTITSLGGEADYAVTFQPMDGGRTLKVTRRITTDYLPETVFAESYYNKTETRAGLGISPSGSVSDTSADPDTSAPTADSKTDDTADSGTYSSSDSNDRNPSSSSSSQAPQRTGNFIVPNGMIVTGLLESSIDTQVTKNNDRFKMTVQSPDDFRGAVIEGYVSTVARSGRVSGRSNVTLNFETITLRTGQRYDFAGFLQSIKDASGKTVKVDSEGMVRGGSRTKETAKRGAAGAGLGAVLGAIIGGGGGAAIGAVIGGGAGASSVLINGRDDVRLMKGTMITIQSSSSIRDNKTLSKK